MPLTSARSNYNRSRSGELFTGEAVGKLLVVGGDLTHPVATRHPSEEGIF
jgi:hypothetical protein